MLNPTGGANPDNINYHDKFPGYDHQWGLLQMSRSRKTWVMSGLVPVLMLPIPLFPTYFYSLSVPTYLHLCLLLCAFWEYGVQIPYTRLSEHID